MNKLDFGIMPDIETLRYWQEFAMLFYRVTIPILMVPIAMASFQIWNKLR